MKKILLTMGKYAVVSDVDFRWLSKFRWRAIWNGSRWYAAAFIYMHRMIAGTPLGLETDHKDGDGLNNRRKNIRIATNHQNQGNKKVSLHSSKYKGVFACRNGMWRVAIVSNGQTIRLGHFKTQLEAAKAYDKKAVEVFGRFARTNFR